MEIQSQLEEMAQYYFDSCSRRTGGPRNWSSQVHLRQSEQGHPLQLQRSLSADFVVRRMDNNIKTQLNPPDGIECRVNASEEARRIRGTRRGKKAHVTRLVNQINQHMLKRLSRKTLPSLKLEFDKAVTQMETINQALFELKPDDDEPEIWITETLIPVIACFENIEKYNLEKSNETASDRSLSEDYSKSTSRKTQSNVNSTGALQYDEMVRKAKLLEHDLAAAKRKEREEQMLSDVQAENEARLRRFKAQMEAETQMLQRLNEDAMRMRRLREMEDNTERAKLEAKLLALKPSEIGKDTLIEAEDETMALKSIKPPKRNDLVKVEALTVAPKPLETCKLLHPDSLESSKKPVNSFMRGPTQQKTTRATTATYPLAPPVANHDCTPLMATPAAQTSPWKNWTVSEHLASPGNNLHATPCHVQSTWGLIPAFPGPPQDAWIDELDELANIQESRMTAHHHCNFSAFEHSLPKFDLSKFDGSPLSWPHWIGRFKSIVHDQPFLNDSQRLAYLQNIVTGAAKTEIQYLGEDGANYALALRMLKARFADAGKIVRAALNTLRGTPSPRIQDHAGLAQLYQALRATVVTLHRQRFIADLLSETNLAMAVEKLPDPLASLVGYGGSET